MATKGKNLSKIHDSNLPKLKGIKIGIVISEWNSDITSALLSGAMEILFASGVKQKDIEIAYVPGSFELPLASKWLASKKSVNGVIAIGSVIRGETPHFDFICSAVSNGIISVSLETEKPIVFCVLTDNTHQQAIDRSGGKHGNKGAECAAALVKMIKLKTHLKK